MALVVTQDATVVVRAARKFVSGEEFLYLGKFYKLQVVDELASDVELNEERKRGGDLAGR